MKRKPLLITAGILLLFIITNPSVTAFKTHLGRGSYNGLSRPVNLLVASVYSDHGIRYLGVMENFINITYKPSQTALLIRKIKLLPPITKKLSVSEFAHLVKNKYPSYQNINDTILVKKILEKYPSYKESVDLTSN